MRIADGAAWRACAGRVAAAREAVRESVERLRRNRRPVLRLARALVHERPATVVVGEGVVVGNRDYGPVSRVRRLGERLEELLDLGHLVEPRLQSNFIV